MKKLLTAIAFLMIASGAFAQFNQGRWLAGGGVGFSTTTSKSDNGNTITTNSRTTSINFGPEVGYFVIDNLAVGAGLGISSTTTKADGSSEKRSNSGVQIIPFVRYYLDPGVFFHGQFGVGSGQSKYTTGTGTQTTVTTKFSTFSWGVGVGYAYFLNDFVAIEPLLMYGSAADKNKDNDNRNINSTLSLNVGFQIYLGPRN